MRFFLCLPAVIVALPILWMFAVPFKTRLACVAAASAFLVVWKAWRPERVVSWTMRVGPAIGGFESFFGVRVVADNIQARTPKIGDSLEDDARRASR